MSTNPWQQLRADRTSAAQAADPCANLCYLATVDANGAPQVRTLVLRDLANDGLGLFVNNTSPKWAQLDAGVSVLVYLPSLSLQYRIQATLAPIPKAIVDDSWQLRPPTPKRLDWLYQRYQPQSAVVGNQAELLDALDKQVPGIPELAPESAQGLELVPQQIERLDLNADGGPHHRQLFKLDHQSQGHSDSSHWQALTLIP